MRRIVFGVVWIVCAISLVTASAGASGGSGGYGGGGNYSPQQRTDAAYERGKKVAKGRAPSARGFEVCVAASSEEADEDGSLVAKELSAGSLRPLRKTSPGQVAARLVDCTDATRLASDQLSQRDLSDLVYYLNKRYRLRL